MRGGETRHPRASFTPGWLLGGILVATALAAPAAAQIAPAEVRISHDVDVPLSGASPAVLRDEEVLDVFGVSQLVADLGPLPESADVTAFHQESPTLALFALDQRVELAPTLSAGKQDIVEWNGSSHAVVFAGIAAGVPVGAGIDAVTRGPSGELLLSFDVSIDLSGLFVADEDLVGWNGASFSTFFDGSAAGVPAGLDVDAAHYFPTEDALWLSFDASGAVGSPALPFDHSDAVAWNVSTSTWVASLEGTLAPGADIDAMHLALPEAGIATGGACGLALLSWLERRRRRETRR